MSDLSSTPLPYYHQPDHYFASVRPLGDAVLLESAAGTDGRYTLISAAPDCRLTVQGEQLIIEREGQSTTRPATELGLWQNTLLQELSTELSLDATSTLSTAPFSGGLIGFWGYELARHLEPGHFKRHSHHPDLKLGRYLWAVVLDHSTQSACFIAHPTLAADQQQQLLGRLQTATTSAYEAPPPAPTFKLQRPFQTDCEKAEYLAAFEQIQRYILAGDCYQVNLTQRFSAPFIGDLWQGYQRLRAISPVPYGAFLDYPAFKVASFSPEQFLSCKAGQVSSKPIKGTRPRGRDQQEDQAQAHALLGSIKDRAENLMIVDLLRNDLGRCCAPGSVSVPKLFELESFANVHHLVSTVTGQLAAGVAPQELLLSAFPGGSITGAPKIRSMEIIEQLEQHPRSVYCGCIGYVSCDGQMETNIAIRTLVAEIGAEQGTDSNTLYCWGGGGIVADSTAEAEYAEALHKVENLLSGLN